MKKLFISVISITVLVLIGVLLGYYGINKLEEENQVRTPENKEKTNQSSPGGAYAVLNEQKNGGSGESQFLYELHNPTDSPVELIFSTSQKYDYTLKNDRGLTIMKYSEDKMFMQVMTEELLKPGGTYSINISVPQPAPGSYKLTVWLTTKTKGDFKKSIDFIVD
jgi:Intracellular proteinase inhibitor